MRPHYLPLLLLAACAHAGPVPPLIDQIRAKAAKGHCVSDDQCRSLPVGQRACGGPEAFVAYSIQDGAAAQELQELAKRLADEQRARQQASGELSTCQAIADPGARCSPPGQCVSGKNKND